ncbi:tail fiber domain-containing protein [Defluviimonas salinarum]|uniref:Tail fiber domain-containing protein n=1 Tax=Defluviimonas salinarum TaxID=2992147 RepID=A0ABT3JAC0_9RHOB|nr:tail fiber domain-containing protein [Defluviimonas salinarum]MCW3784652.1 tail fiber domain-containing protein [Defluviimonas salinarum]
MARKARISLFASTAILTAAAAPLHAELRQDGSSSVETLSRPAFTPSNSLGVLPGDDLGNHIAKKDLNLDGFALFNLGDPVDPMDAVNLAYLEAYVTANGDNMGDHVAAKALDMNGFTITNLPIPVAPDQAANRAYVDTAVLGAGDDLGDHQATQDLDMGNNRVTGLQSPGVGSDAVNLSYMQSYVAANGDDLGDHVATQNVDMSGFTVTNLPAPAGAADAANKAYVDTLVGPLQGEVTGLRATKIMAGVGLFGGGDLTADRTLSFDTAWGDLRYALRGRTIATGPGLIGGGNLSANRTLSFDTSFGDARYAAIGRTISAGDGLTGGGDLAANRSIAVDGTVLRTTGDQSIAGIKTFTGTIDAGGQRVQNLGAPTAATDAVNKSYVDAIGTSKVDTSRMIATGSGLTGGGDLSADRTLAVDATVLRTSGDQTIAGIKTFTGTINAGGQRLQNLGTPTLASDAVNKSYVDGIISGAYSAGDGLTMTGTVLAVDATVVRTAGDQSLDGLKTFTQNVTGASFTSTGPLSFRALDTDTATLPSFGWAVDNNTGLFRAAENIIGFTAGGAERMRVTTSGLSVSNTVTVGNQLDMTSGRILNLAGPTVATDAANKAYVDAAIGAAGGDNLGNHIAAGALNMSGNAVTNVAAPGAAADAANKAYVDALGSAKVDTSRTISAGDGLTGGGDLSANRTLAVDATVLRTTGDQTIAGIKTFTGTINAGGQRLLAVGTPTVATDAANKSYVDALGSGKVDTTRTIATGSGLTGGGDLSANRTISVDGTVIRTTGDQSIAGIKTFTGTINAGGQRLQNLGTPTLASDAANKSYVDGAIAGAAYTAGDGLALAAGAFSVDGTVVRTAGAQSIGGAKTFSATVTGPTFNATSVGGGGFQGIGADSVTQPSFTWSGDLDTGVYTPSSNIVGITTAGVERLRADTSGVGVTGAFSVTGSATFNNALILRNAGNRVLGLFDGSGSAVGYVYSAGTDDSLRISTRLTGSPAVVTAELGLLQNGDIRPMAGQFAGNGSGLANLNASSLASGTVPDARLSGNVVLSTRRVDTGAGLNGGGDLTSDLTMALNADQIRRAGGSAASGVMAYAGNAANPNGQFNSAAINPVNTGSRLNYEGSLYATRFFSSVYLYFSDKRLKDKIETLEGTDGLNGLRKIRPVTYEWKQDHRAAMGVIAQEVEEVYPQVVQTNEAGLKAVDYTQLIAPMIAAIQELDARVQALEAAGR